MNRILIVDEDVNQILGFSTELKIRGIDVVQCRTADECLRVLSRDQKFSLALVDLMLSAEPHSEIFSREKTDDFLLTGIILCQEIRKKLPDFPLVLFTAASFSETINRVRKAIDNIGNAAIVFKHEFATPMEFGDRIEELIEFGKELHKHSGNRHKILDSLMLQPNFAGVGVDLKKLFASFLKKNSKRRGQQLAAGDAKKPRA